MALDYKAIGIRVKKRREELDFTQEKVSEISGYSITHISHIESGKARASLPCFVRLADALSTSVDAFLHDNIKITSTSFDKDLKDMTDNCSQQEKEAIYHAVRLMIVAMNINKETNK